MRSNVWSRWFGGLLWLCGAGCESDSKVDPAQPEPIGEQPAAPSGGDPMPRDASEREAMTPPGPAARDAAPAPMDGQVPLPRPIDAGSPQMTADASGAMPAAPSGGCMKRAVTGQPGVHFHHVHFNTTDPNADLEFYQKYLGAKPVDFCTDGKTPTRATQTERGYFLYTKVATAPDPRLNTYLEHIGWIHPDPNAELERLVQLGAPRFPVGRAQCETAFAGEMACNDYWFYLQAPSGARVEVAKGPGPATMGFGHVHLIMGVDYPFFETATGGAFKNKVIDLVNHTDAALQENILDNEMVVETRGKPIDHVGYSTIDLDAEKARIVAAGLTLAEDISFKPEYGFRSFFLKSAKGIWIEIVEDAPFAAQTP
jgi:catechol 2,3-dioxygenase-like lactoylglutathione lyase family enzyme